MTLTGGGTGAAGTGTITTNTSQNMSVVVEEADGGVLLTGPINGQ
jgi:hypothetical protein